jgi:UDP-N-acetylmuramoyl-tripeptide--D-alanyl-D-alanine ligase
MTLRFEDLLLAMGAVCPGSAPELAEAQISGWSVDSRTLRPGDLYFALPGPNFDGHDFAEAALTNGAAGVVVRQGWRPAGRNCDSKIIAVPDTLAALQNVARWARAQWGGTVIGVTGSAGKTTTKDAVAALLSVAMPVGSTIGNLNNHVGVPLSILRLPADCRAAVLEMGMNHAGEIRELAAIAQPGIGVVTNVGYAHVEFFETGIEGVAAAKRELIEALPADGVAVLNADDSRVRDFGAAHSGRSIRFGFSECAEVRAEDWRPSPEGSRFRALDVEFETPLTGRHAVMNLLAAIAVATAFEIAPERLMDPVRRFSVGRMRGERIERNGMIIWNDCYNSNPEAAQSMIDVLRETPARRRIAVLGEMHELGRAADALHGQVGRYAAGHGVDILIGVGGAARAMVQAAVEAGMPGDAALFVRDSLEAGELARRLARPGDAWLFKGSRRVAMEKALERFLGDGGEKPAIGNGMPQSGASQTRSN